MDARSTATDTKIRVLCVDDSRDLTSILGLCIDREPDMESVGALRSADDLAKQVAKRRADVVLLDLSLPGKDPLVALRELLAEAKGTSAEVRVIVFSGHDEQKVVEGAARAGASGFLSKKAQVPVILEAIRKASRWKRGTDPFEAWA